MEISRGGSTPIVLPSGETRSFLEDGDELILSARAALDGFRTIGFGQCSGIVEAAQ
jgi:fumarylacetoacetase